MSRSFQEAARSTPSHDQSALSVCQRFPRGARELHKFGLEALGASKITIHQPCRCPRASRKPLGAPQVTIYRPCRCLGGSELTIYHTCLCLEASQGATAPIDLVSPHFDAPNRLGFGARRRTPYDQSSVFIKALCSILNVHQGSLSNTPCAARAELLFLLLLVSRRDRRIRVTSRVG